MKATHDDLPAGIAEELLPYQLEGVRFLAAHQRVGMLLDQQGLGKTPMAIRAADYIGAHTINVVCPPIGRIMWQRAFDRWSRELHHVRIFSDDQARHIDPRKVPCHLLIVDEAQRLKNQTAQRTKAVYGKLAKRKDCLAETAEMVWLLSGTLTPNGAHELYTHLRALLPELITHGGQPMYEWQFLDRYFYAYTEPVTQRVVVRGPKPGMLDELRAMIRPYFIRRMKVDVLPQLPPLRTEVAVLPTRSPRYTPEQQRLLENAIALMERDEEVPEIPLSTLRRLTGAAKVPAAVDYIENVLDSEHKVVVFAYHREVIEALRNALQRYRAVVIQGGMSDRQKQQSIDAFQTNPDVRVVIGQINACNAVIDLTAASREIFVEWSFVPGENAQAAERCHRFTTRSAVLASFLTLQGSLDEAITRVVERKTAAITAMWRT